MLFKYIRALANTIKEMTLMPQITLECQGLPCPQPVLKCKQCIESDAPESLAVIVDNDPARENIERFMSSKGYKAESTRQGSDFVVTGIRDETICEECEIMTETQIQGIASDSDRQQICVFISSEVFGSGDDVLGSRLMNNFLATLPEMGNDLWRIILVNGAVKLTIEGSQCLDKLQQLESEGVSILVCGTCLEFFQLSEKKRVGEATNMLDVVTSLQLASKVIKTT